MIKLLSLLLCLLLLTGCAAPAERAEAPAATEVAAAVPSATPAGQYGPILLSMGIDPLRLFSQPSTFLLQAWEVAEMHAAKYQTIPGLYEIEDIYLGGIDSRLWIQIEDDNLYYVALAHPLSEEVYDGLYKQIVDVLGEPHALQDYDENYHRIDIESYHQWACPFAIWELPGYKIELGKTPGGNTEPYLYLAAFQEQMDIQNIYLHHYTQAGPCCPHTNDWIFNEDCIFVDPLLFQDAWEVIVERYKARPAFRGEASRRYVNDLSQPYSYVIPEIQFGELEASFVFQQQEDGRIAEPTYIVDVTGLSPEQIQKTYMQIYNEIDHLAGSRAIQSISLDELDAAQFDPNTWPATSQEYLLQEIWIEREGDVYAFTLSCRQYGEMPWNDVRATIAFTMERKNCE